MSMKYRHMNATLAGVLLSFSLSSVAWAGDGSKPHAAPGGAGAAKVPMHAAIAAHLFERMDDNKDGQVTRVEAQAAAKRLFERMDQNSDGEVTKAESEAGARAIREQELKARFAQLDTNADGKLAPAEAQLPPSVFERLDGNKDKFVTLSELQQGPDVRAEHRDFQFDQADANHDGKVTRDEANKAATTRFDGVDTSHDGQITQAELEAHVAQMAAQKTGSKSHGGGH
jgi:Ca2+-binding EF-hand superfamily protein